MQGGPGVPHACMASPVTALKLALEPAVILLPLTPCSLQFAGHAGASLTPNTEPQRPREFVSVQLQHGYVRVTANATRLEHVVVSSRDGSVMDRWVLEKPAGWCGSRGVLRQGEERVAAA